MDNAIRTGRTRSGFAGFFRVPPRGVPGLFQQRPPLSRLCSVLLSLFFVPLLLLYRFPLAPSTARSRHWACCSTALCSLSGKTGKLPPALPTANSCASATPCLSTICPRWKLADDVRKTGRMGGQTPSRQPQLTGVQHVANAGTRWGLCPVRFDKLPPTSPTSPAPTNANTWPSTQNACRNPVGLCPENSLDGGTNSPFFRSTLDPRPSLGPSLILALQLIRLSAIWPGKLAPTKGPSKYLKCL
jgi:hypothetical protein